MLARISNVEVVSRLLLNIAVSSLEIIKNNSVILGRNLSVLTAFGAE